MLNAFAAPIASRTGRAARVLVAIATLQSISAFQPLAAQPWDTRHQDALWAGAFVDQPITDRVALWFDASWRRLAMGDEPQQFMVRPGLQVTLTPGVRVASGYGYVASTPYGALPAATPQREHRTWQQLLLSHRAGRVSIQHRYRLEQRWVHPLVPGTDATDANAGASANANAGTRTAGPTTYQNRLRYMGRGQIDLSRLRIGGRPWIGYVWNELFMPLGGPAQTLTISQNRASVGVGLPLSTSARVEVGYMNLYNALPARRANEINHTLWVSWHWTGTPLRSR